MSIWAVQHYWFCYSDGGKSNRRASFYLVRSHVNRVHFHVHFFCPSQRANVPGNDLNIDQFRHLTPSWERLTPVLDLEGDTRGMLVPRLRRLCAECCFVCQNIQSKSYSAALCVICLALLSGALWICIQPTTLAFKLLSEAFCFVTYNNLMDYCASLSSKIYPIFRLLLTCYSVLFSSPHIAESMEGFGNTTWP